MAGLIGTRVDPAVDRDRSDRAMADVDNGRGVVIVVGEGTDAVFVPAPALAIVATGEGKLLDSAFEGKSARSLPGMDEDDPIVVVVAVVVVVTEDCASTNSSICLCVSSTSPSAGVLPFPLPLPSPSTDKERQSFFLN